MKSSFLHHALASVLTIGLLTSLSALAGEPIAMTTDVQGQAWIVEGGKQVPLSIMSYLPSGAKLRLEKGARVAVTYFAQPREYTLNGPLQAVVEAGQLRADGGTTTRRTLDPGQNAASKQFSARQRDQQAVATFEMKAVGVLQLDQPADTKLLDRPGEFTWQAIDNVSRYTLTLRDAQGKILYQGESSTPRLKLPANVALVAGQGYRWTVEAIGVDGATQTASSDFAMLDEATRKSLDQRKPKPGASFSERLIYATMLDNAGATLAANAYWKALAKERPQDVTLQQLGSH